MILTCPVCTTRFLVPDSAFRAVSGSALRARRVRCGKCRHEWTAEAPPATTADFAALLQDVPALTPPDEIAPRPIPDGSNLPVKVRRRFLRGINKRHGIAASLLFAALGTAALLALAPALTAPLAGLLHRNATAPLVIENVTTRYEPQTVPAGDNAVPPTDAAATQPTAWSLVVEGTVRNQTDREETVPPVLLLTRDANGALLGTYRPNLQQTSLPAHGTTGFIATLGAADPKLSDVTVQFAGD